MRDLWLTLGATGEVLYYIGGMAKLPPDDDE
jgi:hypothetical protein